MAWDVSADFEKFEEALDWFESRLPVTRPEMADLDVFAAQRAWWISNVAEADIVADVHESIGRAIAKGVPFEEWETEIEGTLTRAWGAPNAPRVETIFRNAAQHAYNAGRYRQLTKPDIATARPFWQFDAVLDTRTTAVCRAADGTVLPADHPWWQTHQPPLHHRCRSAVLALRPSQAAAKGLTPDPTSIAADRGFGNPPALDDWEPDLDDYSPEVGTILQRRLEDQPAPLLTEDED
jgi:SPP1 gp7 family putative phage head morphogenesis protein